MDFYKTIAEQASERWIGRQQIREEKQQRFNAEGVVGIESSARIQMRLDRLSAAATKEKAFKTASSLAATLGQSNPTSFN